VDPAYVIAAFGLARTTLAAGDPAGAIAALAAVPASSSNYQEAQITAVRIQVSARSAPDQVSPDDVRQAGGRLGQLKLDAIQQELLTAEVLRAALEIVAGSKPLGGQLLGCELNERALRFGLEHSYRAQARLAPDSRRRIELVELANGVRPRTWS
jgi:serine/threonine-protein kinase PknG